MLTRADWTRACRLARTGGALQPTLANLNAAYLIVNRRTPFSELERLALE